MANPVILIFQTFGRFCSIFSPVAKLAGRFSRAFYTGYYSRGFRHFDSSSRIQPHVQALIGKKYISVGKKCHLGRNLQLTAWDSYEGQHFTPQISFGDNCQIGDDSHITAVNSIRFGNNVLTGKRILVTDNAHGASDRSLLDLPPTLRPLYSKGPVVIEDNVWIGEKASIMPGVTIGKGSIIAANSVVTHDIPPYSIAAGTPARIIKTL